MNPRLRQLQPYPFERLRALLADAAPPAGLRHIPLSIGEPKHAPPAFVAEALTRALDTLEARWMAHLSGTLDMGQVAIGCALSYLDFRHGGRGWRTGRPALAAWFEGFAARDSMKATEPKG